MFLFNFKWREFPLRDSSNQMRRTIKIRANSHMSTWIGSNDHFCVFPKARMERQLSWFSTTNILSMNHMNPSLPMYSLMYNNVFFHSYLSRHGIYKITNVIIKLLFFLFLPYAVQTTKSWVQVGHFNVIKFWYCYRKNKTHTHVNPGH